MTAPQKERTQPGGAGSQGARGEAIATKQHTLVGVDLEQARLFLDTLDPTATEFYFRAIHPDSRLPVHKYVGTFDVVAPALVAANAQGYGIYVAINAGGHSKGAITDVRAVFADFDRPESWAGVVANPQSLMVVGRDPHMLVETSPGKFHPYWKTGDLPLERFSSMQKAIAFRFGSDPSVHDLSRVMRLPGFFHTKGEPFRTKLHLARPDQPPFSEAELCAAFSVPEGATVSPTPPAVAINSCDGKKVDVDRHADVLQLAGQLARKVHFDGMSRDAAMAALLAERNRGRWSREVSDKELADALDGALAKLRGEWSTSDAANDDPSMPSWATPRSARRALQFVPAAYLIANPQPLQWLIRGLLERNSLGLVFGDPGTGKSFLALDWAASIASGRAWADCKVTPGPVFYIAGEGGNGLGRRLRAWEIHNGCSLTGCPLFVSTVPASLTDHDAVAAALEEVRRMIDQHGKPAMIVFDTVARNFGPGDENKTQDMTAFIAACDLFREETGACILLVHHSGHADKTRARGSMVMKGALDWEYRLILKDGVVLMENVKAKDSEPPTARAFRITPVDLGAFDDEGEPVTSAVLNPAAVMAFSKSGKEGRGKNQTRALRNLREALKEAARSGRFDEDDNPWVSRSEWRDRCERDGLNPRAFNDVVKTLVDRERIRIQDERVTYDEFALE